ncbi:hypothetical protein ACQSSU_03180 [Micromonospora echinospora]
MTKQLVDLELHYAGGWHPAPVYRRTPISIVRGRGDEATEPTPAKLTAELNNQSRDYNPLNPMSSLYGLIGRNTPVRSGITLLVDDFGRTVSGGWGGITGGPAWSTFGVGGSITAADYAVSGGQGLLSVPATTAFRAAWLPSVSLRDVELVATVDTVISNVTGAAIEPANLLLRVQDVNTYYMARVTIDANEAVTLGLYGPSGQLAAVAVALTWLGQPIRIRASVSGPVLSARVWDPAVGEPVGWQVQVVDEQITAPGGVGLRSGVAGGNTNTKPVEFRWSDLVVVDRRYYGEVASWQPDRTEDFDPTAGRGDAWTNIEAAGILRRLKQGADVLASPLRRVLSDLAPTAYWPLEDLDGAAGGASAVDGVAPMAPYGYSRFQIPGSGGAPQSAAGLPKFGTGDGIPGSAPVPDWTQGGVLVGRPPVPTSGTQSWRVAFVAVFPRDRQDAATTFLGWTVTAGTYTSWRAQATSSGLFITARDPATGINGYGVTTATINLFDGLAHMIEVEGRTTGGLLDVRVYIDGWEYGSLEVLAAPNLAYPPGWVDTITPNTLEWKSGEPQVEGMPQLGHIAVWQPSAPISGHVEAMRGHTGETTAERFLRLCAERDVPALVVGDTDQCPTMGAQRIATFTDLLAEIERTDDGILFEPRDWLGLVLRTGASLAGQSAALTVDYAAEQFAPPLAPVVDDQGVHNDITARSPVTGGSARAVRESGPMSVLPPPAGIGRATTQVDVNPADDARLSDYAGWALHKGTVDQVRFSAVTVDLVASPELTAGAAAVDVGDRIDLTGLPVDLAPGDVPLLAPGSIETVGSHTRRITYNATPYAPYEQVATADGEPRAVADGSTLAAGVTASATTLQLATTAAGGLWTTKAAAFPLDLRVGGERVTVSAISGTSSPQTATVSARAVNGVARSWPAGTEVGVWTPAVAAL